jgi:hypothetical protein
MLGHPDVTSGDHAGHSGHTTFPSSLRNLEVRELLQAIAALHLDGLLTDAECRSKRQLLTAQL